jgi:hypothetical protein
MIMLEKQFRDDWILSDKNHTRSKQSFDETVIESITVLSIASIHIDQGDNQDAGLLIHYYS